MFILGFRKGSVGSSRSGASSSNRRSSNSIIVDYKLEVGVTPENEDLDKEILENSIRVAIEENEDTAIFDSNTVSIEGEYLCVYVMANVRSLFCLFAKLFVSLLFLFLFACFLLDCLFAHFFLSKVQVVE